MSKTGANVIVVGSDRIGSDDGAVAPGSAFQSILSANAILPGSNLQVRTGLPEGLQCSPGHEDAPGLLVLLLRSRNQK